MSDRMPRTRRIAALCLSVMCVGATAQARDRGPDLEAGPARALPPEALRELARHRGVASDGSVTLLAGDLALVPASPDRAPSRTRGALEGTARRFLGERLAELAAGAGSEAPEVAFDPPVAVEDGLLALHARQLWDGVEVMDSRLAFVFAGRTLVAFAGRVLPPRPASGVTALDAGQALRALERSGAPHLPSDRRLRSTGERRFAVEDGGGRPHLELAWVVDPETAEAVWLATRGSERWTVGGSEEGRVVSRGSVREGISYPSVSIRHGDARPGTRDWMRPLSSLAPIDGSMSVQRQDLAPGLCQYRLRYDENVSNGISPEVLDHSPGSWQSWQPVAPCTGLPPGMDFLRGPEAPSPYRQQHYYWWLRRARDYVRSAAFRTFAPLSDWDVGLALNEPTGSCGPNASACFLWNPFSRWIHLTRSGSGEHPSLQTLFHEYGHYFVWTYGGLSENCRDGDEGNALDETIADSIALLVGKRYFDPSYGDLGLAFLGDGSEWPLRFTPGSTGCFLAGDEHFMGRPFVQAIWQAAFGANCHDAACPEDLTGIRGDIGWPSEASARDHLLRALAYALKVLPSSATHQQVVAFMHVYLMSHTDPQLASSVIRVFNRHGF